MLPAVNRPKIEKRRFKLPVDLLRKAILLSRVRDQMDDAMMNGSNLQTSWSKVDSCYKTPRKVESMAPQEVSAASVNAPNGYWNHFEQRENDLGDDTTTVSSSILLQLIVNEVDGSVVTSDSTKTADLIFTAQNKDGASTSGTSCARSRGI